MNTVLLEISLQKNDLKISRKILVKRVPRKRMFESLASDIEFLKFDPFPGK